MVTGEVGAGKTVTVSAGSDYQRLRAHLAFLKMTAAAEALPGLLDEAAKAKLTTSAFLERLLSVEVDAVDERRRSALTSSEGLPGRELAWDGVPLATELVRMDPRRRGWTP